MSASEIQKQIQLLGSQATPVFQRKACKHVVWAGVFGFFSRAEQGIGTPVNVVIYNDPAYTEEQIWEWYSNNGESDWWNTDPDEFKLQCAWGRKVIVWRIYEGDLQDIRKTHHDELINAILHGQTIYGNSNHPALQRLRSAYFQKAQGYDKKLGDSWSLASGACKLKGSKEYQSICLKIVDILDGDENDPLYDILIQRTRGFAKSLTEKGGRRLSKISMGELTSMLLKYSVKASSIVNKAKFAEDVRAKTGK